VEEKRGKILVIRGGAIGDFILTLPAIRALRETFSESHLEVLGYPRLAQLAQAAGIIDEFRSIEARALAGFFARKGKLDEILCDYFNSFALVISYLYDPDDIFKTNVGRASKAQFIQGPHRPDESEPIHATEVFLKPLEKLAIFGADPVPKITLGESTPVLPAGNWLAVHPGSGSEKKNWPEERWAEFLAKLVKETDFQILLVGGEAEGERLDRLKKPIPQERIHLAENLPLVSLAELLQSATRFVGHDSGITHLAAALGVPILALWGPSNETIWRPSGPQHQIIKPEGGLATLTVQEVFDTVMRG
jgi:heptosyltransferase-3